MTVKRMDNVGIVVEDIDAAISRRNPHRTCAGAGAGDIAMSTIDVLPPAIDAVIGKLIPCH